MVERGLIALGEWRSSTGCLGALQLYAVRLSALCSGSSQAFLFSIPQWTDGYFYGSAIKRDLTNMKMDATYMFIDIARGLDQAGES
jgi:hypothetical protein